MTGEGKAKPNWRGIIVSGLANGGGLLAGNAISQFLFDIISPKAYGILGEAARLLIGLLLVTAITGLL